MTFSIEKRTNAELFTGERTELYIPKRERKKSEGKIEQGKNLAAKTLRGGNEKSQWQPVWN